VLAAVCESCEMGNSRVSEEDYREGRNLSMVKLAKAYTRKKRKDSKIVERTCWRHVKVKGVG